MNTGGNNMKQLKKLTFLLVTLILLYSSISTTQAQDEPNLGQSEVFLPLVTQGQAEAHSTQQDTDPHHPPSSEQVLRSCLNELNQNQLPIDFVVPDSENGGNFVIPPA